jgi:hypothetical protein
MRGFLVGLFLPTWRPYGTRREWGCGLFFVIFEFLVASSLIGRDLRQAYFLNRTMRKPKKRKGKVEAITDKPAPNCTNRNISSNRSWIIDLEMRKQKTWKNSGLSWDLAQACHFALIDNFGN